MANEDGKGYSISDEQPSANEHSDAHNKTLRSSQPAALNLLSMGVDKTLHPLGESEKPDTEKTVVQPPETEATRSITEPTSSTRETDTELSSFTQWLISLKKPEVHVTKETAPSDHAIIEDDVSGEPVEENVVSQIEEKPIQEAEHSLPDDEKQDEEPAQVVAEPDQPEEEPLENIEEQQPQAEHEDDSDSLEETVPQPTAQVEEPAASSDAVSRPPKSKKKKKKKKKKSGDRATDDSNSMILSDDVFSQTLAELLEEQGHLAEARTMYEKLRLKYPEKWRFFAAKIEELHKKA